MTDTTLATALAAVLPTFVYSCKKTGQVVTVPVGELPVGSIVYAIRKGLGEYFDNYHASETLKSAKRPNGKHESAAALVAAVTPMVAESFTRLMAGDVPGDRGSVIAALAAEIAKLKAEAAARDAAMAATPPVAESGRKR